MGRLLARELGPQNIRNMPKTAAWRKQHNTAGETNSATENYVSDTGETIKPDQVNTYDMNPETAVHESLHKVAFNRVHRTVTKKGGKWINTPQVPGTGRARHDFIEAAEIFDTKTKKAYDQAHQGALKRGETAKDLKPHINAMAAQEYELGARLMYDPSRGHFARQMVQSAQESLADPKGTYTKYRNQQSYVGRGYKEPWEHLRK